MATDYQDVLDSPKVYDGQQSFVGGVNSFDAPELIAPNAVAYAENMDISFDGKIKTRVGTQLVTGVNGSDYNATGVIKQTGRVLSIVQFNPLKINGNSAYVYVAAGLAGSATNGVYISMYDPNANWLASTVVSPLGPPAALDFVSASNTLYATWGSGLYKMTSAAGSAPVFALSAVSGTSTGYPSLCPNAQYMTIHRNRMFVWGNTDVGSSDQDISVSAVLAYENFDLVNRVFQAGTIDEGPVTCCQSWFGNNILIFKQRAIYVVDTTDPIIANWPVQLVTRSVGCVARNSVRLSGNDVLFLGPDGVYSVGRVYAVESQAQVSPPISRPIGNLFTTLPARTLSVTQLAYATTVGNKYILSFPSTSTTLCDTTVVYNLLTQAWDGVYSFGGDNPQCYGKVNNGIYLGVNLPTVPTGDNNSPNIWSAPGAFLVGSTNDYRASDQRSFQASVTNFNWNFISRSSQFESSTSPKKGSHALYYADGLNSTTSVTHQTVIDGSVRDTISTTTMPTSGQARNINDLQAFSTFFALQHKLSGTGAFSCKGVGAAAWLEATPRQLT